jgi:Arm DNA-binding domain
MTVLRDWTVRQCETAKPGLHRVSHNLYLNVEEGGSKQWVFRCSRGGAPREVGLGKFALRSLGEARDLVVDLLRMVHAGKNPREHPSLSPRVRRKAEAAAVTFASEAEALVKNAENGWTGERTAPEWRQLLRDYINPVIGHRHPSDVTIDHVLEILNEPGTTPAGRPFGPLWTTMHPTAQTARMIVEKVLDACEAKKLRDGKNPALLKGLNGLLPSHRHKVRRQKSLNWREAPKFIVRLHEEYEKEQSWHRCSERAGIMPRCMEWSVLMGTRPSESRERTHEEVTVDEHTGITILKIPIEKMKVKVPIDPNDPFFRVPLTPRMLEIRDEMARRFGSTGYIFKSVYPGMSIGVEF